MPVLALLLVAVFFAAGAFFVVVVFLVAVFFAAGAFLVAVFLVAVFFAAGALVVFAAGLSAAVFGPASFTGPEVPGGGSNVSRVITKRKHFGQIVLD